MTELDRISNDETSLFHYVFTTLTGLTIELDAANLQDALAALSTVHNVDSDEIRTMEQRPEGEQRIARAPVDPEIKIAIFGGPGCGISEEVIKSLLEKERGITIVAMPNEADQPRPTDLPLDVQIDLIKKHSINFDPFEVRRLGEPSYPIAGLRRKKGKVRHALPK